MEEELSDTDSFIEEVSEEVRRDRLFGLFRKYAWVAILLVILIVGGAAFNEYRKITDQRNAAKLGDKLFEALQADSATRLTLLNEIEPKKIDGIALVDLIKVNTLIELGSTNEAIELLRDISSNVEYNPMYRELADFKSILLSDSSLQQKYDNLKSYTEPGSTLRLIAMEEVALIQIQLKDFSEAIKTLDALIQEPEINRGQAKRASDLLRTLRDSVSANSSE